MTWASFDHRRYAPTGLLATNPHAAAHARFACISGLSEDDALGERQILRVVHRVRGPAHVVAPRVGPRLATAARLLFAAERAADLGSARADVDVRDAAIRAGARD